MKILFKVLVTLCALLLTSHAYAQWSGQAGLGVVSASGNTDNRSINGTLGIVKESGQWKHNVFADIYKAKTDGAESADRLTLGYKADRIFSTRMYGWAGLRYETDSFADIDRKLVGTSGIGYKVLLGPVHTLNVEAGLGYQSTSFISALPDSSGAVVVLRAIYGAKLTDTVTLKQRLELEAGSENKLITSITGLDVKMSDALSLSLGYNIRRNSDILGARGKKTDSITTINLVYAIK